MKKIFLIVMAVFMFVLSACSGSVSTQIGDPTADVTPVVSDTPLETPTPVETTTEEPTVAPTEEATEDPSVIPAPDILQLVLKDDGTAVNGVESGYAITNHGASKDIAKDASVGMNVATFKGGGCAYNMDLVDVYGDLELSYTFEVFFKATARPSDDTYWGLVDNQEAGGFGLNLKPAEGGGQYIRYAQKIDGVYQNPGDYNIDLDKWYHCVVTWDETLLVMYINGVKVGELDTGYGIPEFTTVDSAMYLAI
ncbi:MAG: hypothetical protein IKU26_03060, partial [Clostridia bacterium]|nr:hypothetical protein [Clostridia bacterium]